MKKQALIIVDMSNDFVADNGGLTVGESAQRIVPYIVQLADQFMSEGNVVAVAMDAHDEDDPHFELWPKHNVKGTWGQQLYGELNEWYEKNEAHVIYIPKSNYNSFFKTSLKDQLTEHNVDTVHVVGVCSDICDFATVAGADAYGFKTVVHKKGIATFTHQLPQFQTMLKEGYKPEDVILELMKVSFHTEVIE